MHFMRQRRETTNVFSNSKTARAGGLHTKNETQKDKNNIYLGNGVYVYKLNNTNETSDWRVRNVDIPKLYRLGFPVAGEVGRPTSDVNDKSAGDGTVSGIHPWILGLASFVGCLIIMVVITVIFLGRKWMANGWQDRHCNHPVDDRDDLVVEADPESPKIVGNFSGASAPTFPEHTNVYHGTCAANQTQYETQAVNGFSILNPTETRSTLPAYVPYDTGALANFQNLSFDRFDILPESLNTATVNQFTATSSSNTPTYDLEFNHAHPIQETSNDFIPITYNKDVNNSVDNSNACLQQQINITPEYPLYSGSTSDLNNDNDKEQIFYTNQKEYQQQLEQLQPAEIEAEKQYLDKNINNVERNIDNSLNLLISCNRSDRNFNHSNDIQQFPISICDRRYILNSPQKQNCDIPLISCDIGSDDNSQPDICIYSNKNNVTCEHAPKKTDTSGIRSMLRERRKSFDFMINEIPVIDVIDNRNHGDVSSLQGHLALTESDGCKSTGSDDATIDCFEFTNLYRQNLTI